MRCQCRRQQQLQGQAEAPLLPLSLGACQQQRAHLWAQRGRRPSTRECYAIRLQLQKARPRLCLRYQQSMPMQVQLWGHPRKLPPVEPLCAPRTAPHQSPHPLVSLVLPPKLLLRSRARTNAARSARLHPSRSRRRWLQRAPSPPQRGGRLGTSARPQVSEAMRHPPPLP